MMISKAQYQLEFDGGQPEGIKEAVEPIMTEHSLATTINTIAKLLRSLQSRGIQANISVSETKRFFIIRFTNGNKEDEILINWKKENPNYKYHAYRSFLLSFLKNII